MAAAAAAAVASIAEEKQRKLEKPVVTVAQALSIASELFGLEAGAGAGSCKALDSYDDLNFCVRGTLRGGAGGGEQLYTLKIHNGVESQQPALIELQNATMLHLEARGVAVPAPLPAVGGELLVYRELLLRDGATARRHACRLLRWLPGRMLCEVEQPPRLLRQLGAYVGQMDRHLQAFESAAARSRVLLWDLKNVPQLRGFAELITDSDAAVAARRKATALQVLAAFAAEVEPRWGECRAGVLHNDANDHNIVVSDDSADALAVSGVLDFGDIVHSYYVCELAICMAYSMLEKAEPVTAAASVYAGYCAEFPLTAAEEQCVYVLVACRLAQSVIMSSYSFSQDPTNEYLLVTQQPGWIALETWWSADPDEVMGKLEAAKTHR